MRNIKAEAERLRIGLVCRWRTIPEVVAWADEVLLSEPAPPPQFVNLSLSVKSPVEEVIHLLEEIPGSIDRVTIMRECLADILCWMGDDIERGEQIAQVIYTLASSGMLPETEFGREPFNFEDGFILAKSGIYGTIANQLTRLQDWLETHAQRDETQ